MTLRKKILVWGLLLFIGLIISLVLLAPVLVDSDTLKQRIQAAVTQNNLGKVDYNKVDLSLFPLPHLEIQKLRLSSKGDVYKVRSLKIYLELLPMLRGQLKLSKLYIDSPELTMVLPEESAEEKGEKTDYALSDLSESLNTVAKSLMSYSSGLEARIHHAHIGLSQKGRPLFLIQDFSLAADMSITGSGSFDIQLDAASPAINLQSGQNSVVFDCERLKAEIKVQDDKMILSLDELALKDPGLRMTGLLSADSKASKLKMDLDASDIDIKSLRKSLLKLFGKNETVRELFAYIRGGGIPKLHIQFEGSRLEDLEYIDNFKIHGRMKDGNISIGDIGMTLTDVNGDAKIMNGLLEASKATARSGESFGREGLFKLGLAEDDYTFFLDVLLKTRLEKIPGILKKAVDNEAFIHELKKISNLKGSGEARLILGDTLDSIEASVNISKIQLSGDHLRVPYPVKIDHGQLDYNKNRIQLKDITGSMGNSDFSGIDCLIQWQDDLFIKIPAGSMSIVCDEIYPWVADFETLKKELTEIKYIKGRATISDLKIKIPEDEKEQWQLSFDCEPHKVFLKTTEFPEDIQLLSGKYTFSSKKTLFRECKIRLLDADFNLSGTLSGSLKKPERIEVTASGIVGSSALQYAYQQAELSDAFAVHGPIDFNESRINWEPSGTFSYIGAFEFPKGTKISADFSSRPNNLDMKRLDIQDHDSAAQIAFGLSDREFNLKFNGQIHSNTLDDIFVSEKWSSGFIKGDLESVFVKKNLSKSSFDGQLAGENIQIPIMDSEPVFIKNIKLAAHKNRISVKTLSINYQGNSAEIKGSVDKNAEGFNLDLEASAGDLKWISNKEESKKKIIHKKSETLSKGWHYPFFGEIKLSAKSFAWDRYVWKPFHAEISPSDDGLKVNVVNAKLCGIDSLGMLHLKKDEMGLDFQLIAVDQDVKPCYACLTNNQVQMSGSFDFVGYIKSHGIPEDLVQNATGHFDFLARKGKITNDKKLSRILEVINFTEIVKGKVPDLKTKGFSYETIHIKGTMNNETLDFNKIYMDGKTLDLLGQGNLDLKTNLLQVELLAAPFQTVDTAIKYIPGVDYLKIGNLVSIPVRVEGDVSDPEVKVIPVEAVRSSLKDFAEKTIRSPIQFLESVIPGRKKE